MEENQPTPPQFVKPETKQVEVEKVPDAPLPSEPDTPPKKPKSKKKLLIIIGIVVAVLLTAGALWYFLIRDSGQTAETSQEQQVAEVTEREYEGLPDTVAYAYRDIDSEPYKIYTRPAVSGERAEAMTLPAGVYISHSAVHGNQVVFVTEPEAATDEVLTIWYSDDAGASYREIYKDEAITAEDSIGTQVTSIIFSTDGSVVLAGILPADGGNQVTELSLDGLNQQKVIFTTDDRGVALEGYDRANQKTLYFSGCYNCDGIIHKTLNLYDESSDSTVTVYDSPVVQLNVAVKDDFSKVLISEGTSDESTADELGGGLAAPYTIKTIAVEEGAVAETLTQVDELVTEVGYTYADTGYYVTQQEIIRLNDATPSLAYETAGIIINSGAYFVGEDSVVVAVGEFFDFALDYFKSGSEAPVNVLQGDANTIVFGVPIK